IPVIFARFSLSVSRLIPSQTTHHIGMQLPSNLYVNGAPPTERSPIMSNEKAGSSGETHQTTKDTDQTLTTAQGVPVSDDQNWLTAGQRGPQLIEDHIAREKIF